MKENNVKTFTYGEFQKRLNSTPVPGVRYFRSQDYFVASTSAIEKFSPIEAGVPYRFERAGLLVFYKGDLDMELNLLERHIAAPSLVYAADGSIVKIISGSGNIEFGALMLSQDFLAQAFGFRVPESFSERQKDFVKGITEEQSTRLKNMLDLAVTISEEAQAKGKTFESAARCISTILSYADDLTSEAPEANSDRASEIFSTFIALVRQHCRQEHELSFYAGKMCLAERYLGRMIKQAGGNTAKYWIDKALLTNAQVMLRSGRNTISEISDELGFTQSGIFCRFFKNYTGQTPSEYRKG